MRQQLGQRLLAVGERVGQDHLAEVVDVVEEHVLGAAQADALGAEGDRLERLLRLVGVGAHLQRAVLRRPRSSAARSACNVSASSGLSVLVISTCRISLGRVSTLPSKTSPVKPSIEIESPCLEHLAVDGDGAGVVVDVQVAAADDAGLAHLAADQGRVRAGAAEGRENALGDLHAAQIFGARLAAHQDQLHVVVLQPLGFGVRGVEADLAAWRRRGRR